MQTFHTPLGKAGSDQLYGMEEAVQGDLKAMFYAGADRNALDYGVGLAVHAGSNPDDAIRLKMQRRECDARITASAGKAIERALQLIYAYGTDRIMGRGFPGVDEKQLEKDTRRGHDLIRLREVILRDLTGRDMASGLEAAYQKALNRGLLVVSLDDEHMWTTFATPEDVPLRETTSTGIRDGTEYTTDHSSVGSLLGRFPKQKESPFAKMPIKTFEQFLAKTDCAYYECDDKNGKRRNMSWTSYSLRDHEEGRPYVVAGMRFFARLAKELVGLAKQPWVIDKDRLVREYVRGNYNVSRYVETLLMQRYQGDIELPPIIPAEEMVAKYHEIVPNMRAEVERGYDHLRQKQSWMTNKASDTKK